MNTETIPSASDYLAHYYKQKEEALTRLKANRSRLMKALKRLGATHVVVSYSGCGDSGQIDEVTVQKGDEVLDATKGIFILCSTSKWSAEESRWIDRTKSKRTPLKEAIHDFVYDWIEAEYAGWENNDGASGECTIEVATDEFNLSHTYYFTESETEVRSL